MSDITMIFGFLFLLGLGLMGMLTTWWTLFPGLVERARIRVEKTPWKSFALGLVGLGLFTIPIAVLFTQPGGPAQTLGAAGLAFLLTFATLGAAGIASLMGSRLSISLRQESVPAYGFLRGTAALVLAAGVPFLGWFVLVPIALVESVGAALFAVLHWTPRMKLPEPAEA